MVGACQQNSGIFLVRGGGPDEIPAGADPGTGTRCRRPNHRAGSGLGAARDRTGCQRGPRPRLGRDTGDQITGQAAGSERPGTGRDAGEGRGLGRDKMSVTKSPGRQRTRSGQGPDGMPAGAEAWAGTRCRRGPRLSRQGANQLKRKRSIISSSNSGFSKSFSLVIIKLLCSKNPASW